MMSGGLARRGPCSLFAVVLALAISMPAPSAWCAIARHVLVVGFDGLSPQGIQAVSTPHFDTLIQGGAHSFHARAVMPTSSSPNWASMIMGAGPEQHGVTANAWTGINNDIEPTVAGPGKIFPTIFSLIREQHKEAYTAVVHDWDGFGRLFERKLVDEIISADGEEDTAVQTCSLLASKSPELLFVHFDHVDHALHDIGFMSPEYLKAVEAADAYLGRILDTLRASGKLEETLILVTADHGGEGTGHGGATMAEIEIPWIAHGPGVAVGKTISAPVNTYDTAATIAYALGLEQPQAWIARPVVEAFVPEAAAGPSQ